MNFIELTFSHTKIFFLTHCSKFRHCTVSCVLILRYRANVDVMENHALPGSILLSNS